jgi:hypothetical protein
MIIPLNYGIFKNGNAYILSRKFIKKIDYTLPVF